jgi:catechol 2,3-dioxygenase-like lactoylglutathione lyase family enzyme
MSIELNHTIVGATDAHASARFLAGILGLATGADAGHFVPLRLANGVTLDYMDRSRVTPQHYAFLVSDDDFDAAFARIREGGLTYFADPGFRRPGEINTRWGGRGVYFHDPDGHIMELLTCAP